MTHFKLAFASVLVAFIAVLALAWHNKQITKAE